MEGVIASVPIRIVIRSVPIHQRTTAEVPTADKKAPQLTVHNPYGYRKCAVRDLYR